MTGEHEAFRAPVPPSGGADLADVREELEELRGALAAAVRALGTASGRTDDVVRRMESLERDLADVLVEVRDFRAEFNGLRPVLLAALERTRDGDK